MIGRNTPNKYAATVYFTEEEMDLLERIAKKEERSRTQVIRRLALDGLKLMREKDHG